jgi:hypothetical protein
MHDTSASVATIDFILHPLLTLSTTLSTAIAAVVTLHCCVRTAAASV